MLNINMTSIAEFILDTFEESISFCIDTLESIYIGNISVWTILLTIILLSFLIPIIITLISRSGGMKNK